MQTIAILQPAIVLGLWSVVALIWMYATRIPAMQAGKPDDYAHPDSFVSLPTEVRRVADNYNHLFEAPTLFYATISIIALSGHVDALFVQLAWAYAIARIVHSLWQNLINQVLVRFGIFIVSWLILAIMIIREAVRLFA